MKSNDNAPNESELLTKKQTAFYLQVSERTVDNLMSRRQLPFIRLGNRLIRFPKSAVKARLKELTVNAG
jgi:excisionase family DNA binding protein